MNFTPGVVEKEDVDVLTLHRLRTLKVVEGYGRIIWVSVKGSSLRLELAPKLLCSHCTINE